MKRRKKVLSLISLLMIVPMIFVSCKGTGSSDDTASGSRAASSAKDNTGMARSLNEIKTSGKIRIGVFSDKAPFGYVDSDGAYQGYDVYFAEQIGKDLGAKVEYVSVEPASRVEYLKTAKVDTIAPAVQKDNTELLNWLNEEIKTLGRENFFHKDYEETLAPVYGEAVQPDSLVVEGGTVE